MPDDPEQQLPARRVKPVVAREVPPGPSSSTEESTVRVPQPQPVTEASRPDAEPLVDPTQLGRRRRKHTHARRYQLAQVLIAGSILATLGAVTTLALGDRHIAQTLSLAAIGTSAIALLLASSTRLASRVAGYALAALILAALATVIALALPELPAWTSSLAFPRFIA